LQTEFAWAYHEYQKSIGLFKVYKSTASLN
jgi:hypothetical protein